jgi:Tfp pilus assembly protein PilO
MDNHQLQGQIIEPGNQKVIDGLNCMVINMKCRGELEKVYDFFASLQRLDRAVKIQRVMLRNEAGYSGNVNMSTEAVVYSSAGKEEG